MKILLYFLCLTFFVDVACSSPKQFVHTSSGQQVTSYVPLSQSPNANELRSRSSSLSSNAATFAASFYKFIAAPSEKTVILGAGRQQSKSPLTNPIQSARTTVEDYVDLVNHDSEELRLLHNNSPYNLFFEYVSSKGSDSSIMVPAYTICRWHREVVPLIRQDLLSAQYNIQFYGTEPMQVVGDQELYRCYGKKIICLVSVCADQIKVDMTQRNRSSVIESMSRSSDGKFGLYFQAYPGNNVHIFPQALP